MMFIWSSITLFYAIDNQYDILYNAFILLNLFIFQKKNSNFARCNHK